MGSAPDWRIQSVRLSGVGREPIASVTDQRLRGPTGSTCAKIYKESSNAGQHLRPSRSQPASSTFQRISPTMPGGAVVDTHLETADDVEHIEAPVTLKAYLMCAFASFGGIFFGYDSVSTLVGNDACGFDIDSCAVLGVH